ncbi:DEAD/DEAH box helicase [Rhodococcus sp. NPDC078407]|uniref:DEAD/DEAH box helicase n=1 Tax=Rhodococcus sp. NPDC078407 TaxID=3364509 RepID=UPI0037CBC22D
MPGKSPKGRSAGSTPPGTSFADLGLPVVLVHSLKNAGVSEPFPIQIAAVPDALAGRDVLGRAPTGSGKTLAFGLPLLVRLAGRRSEPAAPRGLVLVPTRELALQIHEVLDQHGATFGLRTLGVVGGVPLERNVREIQRGVDIVVATPGRLNDLLERRSISLDRIEMTVIDEADRMVDMGFLPQIESLLAATPPDGQRLLFSATLDQDTDRLVQRFMDDPAEHSTADSVSVPDIAHYVFEVDPARKTAIAAALANRDGRTLLFVRTTHAVDRLTDECRRLGVPVSSLHGNKTQAHRTRSLAAFADGSSPALIATDVAARGVHVDDVTLVVHVDPPVDSKDYVHRAGRTARAGASGTVVTLATGDQMARVRAMAEEAKISPVIVDTEADPTSWHRTTGARTPIGRPLPGPADASSSAHGERPDRKARRGAVPSRHERAGRTGGGRGGHRGRRG